MLGTFLLVSAFDFTLLFLAFELINFSSYILITSSVSFKDEHKESAKTAEAAIKYYLIGGLGSILTSISIALLLFLFGSTNFLIIASSSLNISSLSFAFSLPFKSFTTFTFIIFLLGIFFKFGIFPCHT
jgi:NADH-quinone oxidoreductase subunit N